MYNADLVLKNSEFKLFQELMYSHAGIRLAAKKHSLVQNRLRKRIEHLKMSTYRQYYDYIVARGNESEFQECLNALTTNETYFFRHKKHWDFIKDVIIPQWKNKNYKGSTFRAWSAAASTGEEAHSMAILIRDLLPETEGWRIAIDATDINEDVLSRAKTGVYGEYSLQKLTKLCLKKYFTVGGGEGMHTVSQRIKKLVSFKLHNLQIPVLNKQYDVVFLRNVMIYFDDASKMKVLRNIEKCLSPGGYLFLGGAETLPGSENSKFKYIQPTIYRKNGNE